MKKSLFLCGALFALTAFVGCSDDDDPKVEAPTLKLSTNVVTVSADEPGAWKERLLHQKHHQWNFYALSPGAVQHHGIL